MLSTRVVGLACAVTVFVCLLAAPVSAQLPDKRTLFTFSEPVSLPGVTLPAGQYLFRLADPETSRRVVQVLNADGTKPYGLFFALSAERFEPAATPEVRFMETAVGTPAAIRTWWYPGERTGYEFVYPKEQARRLAVGVNQPVLTTQALTTTTEQTNTDDLARVASGGQETHVSANTAPIAATPAGGTQAGQIASSSLVLSTPSIPGVGTVPALSDGASTPMGTYQWLGELVSVDTMAKTITVKSRLAYPDTVSDLKQFKAGDPVWLIWSGVHDYSDAVRHVRRFEGGNTIDENLVLRAELVSTEEPHQYVTFRVKVPESSLTTISAMTPGEWVRVTTRLRAPTDTEAVVAVTPYVYPTD